MYRWVARQRLARLMETADVDALVASTPRTSSTRRPGLASATGSSPASSATRSSPATGLRCPPPTLRRQHVGHGIGLNVYDPPILRAGNDTELLPGMVLNVEPPLLRGRLRWLAGRGPDRDHRDGRGDGDAHRAGVAAGLGVQEPAAPPGAFPTAGRPSRHPHRRLGGGGRWRHCEGCRRGRAVWA